MKFFAIITGILLIYLVNYTSLSIYLYLSSILLHFVLKAYFPATKPTQDQEKVLLFKISYIFPFYALKSKPNSFAKFFM